MASAEFSLIRLSDSNSDSDWWTEERKSRLMICCLRLLGSEMFPWQPPPSTVPLTFRRSSAASSFFWISSRDGSRRCGMEALSSGTPSKDGGLRMTSKAWPDARLFSSITSTSLMTHQPRSTASVVFDCVVVLCYFKFVAPPPLWDPNLWDTVQNEKRALFLPSALYVGFSIVRGFRQAQKRDTRGSSLTFSL